MARIIALASGKGGSGKTSITVNLAVALAQSGKKVTVVDADIAMANIGILLGVERAPISLHNVLMGEAKIQDSIYDGPAGIKYVPSGLSLERIKKVDYDKLPSAVSELEKNSDYILVDCPPGIERDAIAAVSSARELLLVINPEPIALADALKIKTVAEKNNVKVIGIVSNMVIGDRNEVKKSELETLLGVKVITEISEDANAKRASAAQQVAVLKFPNSQFAQGINELAAYFTGVKIKTPTQKRSLIDSILSIFKK